MYSVSSSKIWVFGAKMEGGDEGDDDGVVVKLIRCAVLECCKPIWSLSISFGFLLVGEENGVRAFNLRRLVKGRDNKAKNLKSDSRGSSLPNGVIGNDYRKHGARDRGSESQSIEGLSEVTCNGDVEWKVGKHRVLIAKCIKIVMTSRSTSIVITLDMEIIRCAQLNIDANIERESILHAPKLKLKPEVTKVRMALQMMLMSTRQVLPIFPWLVDLPLEKFQMALAHVLQVYPKAFDACSGLCMHFGAVIVF